MKKEEKDLITKDLKQYVESKGSQNKAATSLGVSSATISQILNDKTKLVADEMWRRIKAAMNTNPTEWKIVETTDYKNNAKHYDRCTRAITCNGGYRLSW